MVLAGTTGRPRRTRRSTELIAYGPPIRLCVLGEGPPPTLTRADGVACLKRMYPQDQWEEMGLKFFGVWTREDNEMWSDE